MNVEWTKKQWEIGIIEPEYIEFLKEEYLSDIMRGEDTQAVNSLVAYAGFLNALRINSDSYPLYLEVLNSNNAVAVDALLEGYEPERYLDCVVPNHYIVESFFRFLEAHKRNEVYDRILQVIVGYFDKVYRSTTEGYQLHGPTVADINSLGKFLDESRDQDDPLNRIILDVLQYITTLEAPYETDGNKLEIARQASRIRSDFFDNNHSLVESLTAVTLEQLDNPTYGIRPDRVYGGVPGRKPVTAT